MNKDKKLKILALALLFIPTGLITANNDKDEKKLEITSFKYNDNFDEYSTLDFHGNKLDTCKNVSFNSKKIPFEKTENRVSIKYSELNSLNGNITFNCEKDITYSYAIPYITNAYQDKNNKSKLIIEGKNFGYNPKAYTTGMSSKVISGSDNTIVLELGKSGYFDELYVQNKSGSKSNLYESPVKLPQIDYIKGENGFYAGEIINICGKNLKKNYDVKIAGIKYSSSFKELKNNCLIIKIPLDSIGNKSIQVIGDNFETKSLNLNIKGIRPTIKNALERSVIDKSGTSVNGLKIYGNDFGDALDKTKVYVNGKQVEIFSLTDTEIEAEAGEYQNGENYIYVDKNGSLSEVFGINKTLDIPKIMEIKSFDIDDSYRYFEVVMNLGFNEKTDFIYLNSGKLKIEGCYLSNCRVKVPVNNLKGVMSVYRYDEKISPDFQFDIRKELTPVLEKVEFTGKLKPKAKVSIIGKNLYGVKSNSSNLFYKNNDGREESKLNGQSIEGILDNKFNVDSTSSINVNAYGFSASQSFKLQEHKGNVIYFPATIYDAEGENLSINPGSVVKLTGNGFKKSDIVYFGSEKTYPKSVSNDGKELVTVIPKTLRGGQTSIYIENEYNLKSKPFSFIVEDSGVTPKIKFETEKNNSNETIYTSKKSNNYNLITFSVNNKITDVYIDKIDFKISGKEISNLGTFSLYQGNKKLFTKKTDSNGLVSFSNFTIPKNYSDTKIILKKDSPFINTGEYYVSINPNTLKVKQVNTEKNMDIIDTSNLNPSSFKVTYLEESTCVDSKYDKSNCNRLDIVDNNVDTNDYIESGIQPTPAKELPKESVKDSTPPQKNIVDNNINESEIDKKVIIVYKAVKSFISKQSKGNKRKEIMYYDAFINYIKDYLPKSKSEEQRLLLKKVYIKLKIERTKMVK